MSDFISSGGWSLVGTAGRIHRGKAKMVSCVVCGDDLPAAHGVGAASGHHGELLQGIFTDESGNLHRALVTLPNPARLTEAAFCSNSKRIGYTVPPQSSKTAAAAAATIVALTNDGLPAGGTVSLRSNIPRGVGMGSSTSDVVATIRAVASAVGRLPSPIMIARLAAEIEGACDPIMHDAAPTLFAQREGRVIETFSAPLPAMVVVGCFAASGSVDTLGLPSPNYSVAEVAKFDNLRALLRHSLSSGDVSGVAHVATSSAILNQRLVPLDLLPDLLAMCRSAGGSGVQVSHSGTLAGIIFDAKDDGTNRAEWCVGKLRRRGVALTDLILT